VRAPHLPKLEWVPFAQFPDIIEQGTALLN